MSSNKKKPIIIRANRDESDDTDAGGKSGQIEFREFIKSTPERDDILPPDEMRRLLAVHKSAHESHVQKQKKLQEQRKDLKDGKVSLDHYRQGLASRQIGYKAHPILSDKAQFSGIDRQVNPEPNEQLSEANQDKRNELELKYSLRYAPEAAPRFNPRPQRG